MKKETADAICDVMENDGVEFDRRDGYSGRGMRGEETVGIVIGSYGKFLRAVVDAALILARNAPEGEFWESVEEFTQDVQRFKTDSMGHDVIVY